MVESWVLIEGREVDREKLRSLSLANAKQVLIGGMPGSFVLHVAATTVADLREALVDFGGVPGVAEVLLMTMRNRA